MVRQVFGSTESPGPFNGLDVLANRPRFGRVYATEETNAGGAGGDSVKRVRCAVIDGIIVFNFSSNAFSNPITIPYYELKNDILHPAQGGPHGIVLDFTGVEDVDPSFLRRVLNGVQLGYQMAEGLKGKAPVICNLDKAYLKAANIDEIFEVFPDISSAVARAKEIKKDTKWHIC